MKRTSRLLLTISIAASLAACGNSDMNQAPTAAAAPNAQVPVSGAPADAIPTNTSAASESPADINAAPVNADPAMPPDSGTPARTRAHSRAVSSDPPSRVARLAQMDGDVQFSPAGETRWNRANRNRPLVTGDRILTGGNARAALELGDSAVRISANSAFNVLSLDDRTAQIQLSQGTINLRVRTLDSGQNYEIDTPILAFVADRPGDYRIEAVGNGRATVVTVAEGSGTVYGDNGVNRVVRAGHSYQFNDSRLVDAIDRGPPATDDFDRYSAARDGRYSNSASRRHVSAGVIGYDDLDDNGDWQATADYGQVWYPTHVARDWAPYRDGQWEWVDPYGWTWVDNAPWGFAPYHYGRWVRIHDRWGWLPGAPVERAVYAPALVAFVGHSNRNAPNRGDDEPVGWFPLGPTDVYVPPYQVSQDYFTNINVTNISVSNKTVVNNTVINNYYNNSITPNAAQHIDYAYSTTPQAVTVVPRGVFTGALPVAAAAIVIQPNTLTAAGTASTPHVAPGAASLGIREGARPGGTPSGAFDRVVIARNAPPPPPVPFAAREKLIAKQDGAPIAAQQLRQMQQARAEGQVPPQRIRLATPGATTAKGAGVPPVANAPNKTPAVAASAGSTGRPGLVNPPQASDVTGSPADSAAQARAMTQRAAQDRAAKAAEARAAQAQAQNAAAQERAAKMDAQKAAATEQAAQVEKAKLVAAQQHAAQVQQMQQAQQAQNAAAQERAAKMDAQKAAATEHAAQVEKAKLAAAQQHAAQVQQMLQAQQAQNAAAQERAAKMDAQKAAATEQAAKLQQAKLAAAQEHAAQAQKVQQAQTAVAQERAAKMKAESVAAQEQAAKLQQAKLAAAQEHAAQIQQTQNAAAQERAAKMEAQKAAATEQAAQLQQAKLTAAQAHAAQVQQAQDAAAQNPEAKIKAQRAAVDERAAQAKSQRDAAHQRQPQQTDPTSPQKPAPKAKQPADTVPDPDLKKKDSGEQPPVQ